MFESLLVSVVMPVALLAEGVDRNYVPHDREASGRVVALLAEGVDRNNDLSNLNSGVGGRPPRGGRG